MKKAEINRIKKMIRRVEELDYSIGNARFLSAIQISELERELVLLEEELEDLKVFDGKGGFRIDMEETFGEEIARKFDNMIG